MTDLMPETVLPDDYPIFPGYLYVADGTVINSPIPHKTTAAKLKEHLGCEVLTKCNMVKRNVVHRMVEYIPPSEGGIQVMSAKEFLDRGGFK